VAVYGGPRERAVRTSVKVRNDRVGIIVDFEIFSSRLFGRRLFDSVDIDSLLVLSKMGLFLTCQE